MNTTIKTYGRRWAIAGILGLIVGCGIGQSAYASSLSHLLREACGSDTRRTVHPWPSSPGMTASCYDSVAHDFRIAQIMHLDPDIAANRMSRNAWTCEYDRRQNERRLVGLSVTPRQSCRNEARDLERNYQGEGL